MSRCHATCVPTTKSLFSRPRARAGCGLPSTRGGGVDPGINGAPPGGWTLESSAVFLVRSRMGRGTDIHGHEPRWDRRRRRFDRGAEGALPRLSRLIVDAHVGASRSRSRLSLAGCRIKGESPIPWRRPRQRRKNKSVDCRRPRVAAREVLSRATSCRFVRCDLDRARDHDRRVPVYTRNKVGEPFTLQTWPEHNLYTSSSYTCGVAIPRGVASLARARSRLRRRAPIK